MAPRATSDELRAWWAAGDWNRLVPIVRAIASATCRKFTRDPDELEDWLQTTVVRCWRADEVPLHPVSFIRACAWNLLRDVRKSYERRHRVLFTAAVTNTCAAPDTVVLHPDFHALHAAVERLPVTLRDVVRFGVLQEQSYLDVAARLGINHGAARMRRMRALQLLRADPSLHHYAA